MPKLITLGTSHGDPGLRRFNSASLLRTSGGDYLFEAGAPVNALMIRKGIPFAGLKAVFVSHTHEDHIGGLPGLIKSLVKRPEPGQHTDFFLPEKSCTDGLLAFMASTHRPWSEELLSLAEIRDGVIFDDGNLKVTAFRTEHIPAEDGVLFPTWAFLAETEGVRIVFTGDLSRDLHDFPVAAFDRPAVCVMECQHYAPERAVPIFRRIPVIRFIGVHISARWDGHAGELYRALGSPPFPFAMAEDGMEFDLAAPPPSPRRSRERVFTAAVLADLHLQDDGGTVKETVWKWAAAEIAARKPEAIVSAGDMTALGTPAAARRLRSGFRRLPGRFYFTPGNSELRSPASASEVAALLKSPDRSRDLLLLDSSSGGFSAAARALLARMIAENSAGNLLAVTHYPPANLPEEDRWLLAAAIRSGIIGMLVCGHLHCDRSFRWGGIRCELVRGLDPDKTIGGPPAVAFFSRRRDGGWVRRDVPCRDADPACWSPEERAALLENELGLSGMSDPEGTLEFAAREKVPVFEWRYAATDPERSAGFRSRLEGWRRNGGRCFSIHFPDLGWENGGVSGLEAFSAAARAARELRAQRITIHVPRISVGVFSDPAVADAVADGAARILKPLADAGILIGVENLHMRPGEKDDDARGFGYTPDEVLAFADMLTARGATAGIHFDLGHARNNAPFNNRYPISSWFARCGSRINGCHLHQVTCGENGKMLNHQALVEPFGRLVSLGSLFLALRSRQMAPAPLILEIRGGRGPESWLRLRGYPAN